MRVIILAAAYLIGSTLAADAARTLFVGSQIRLTGMLGCSTLELAAEVFETHRTHGYPAANQLIKRHAPDVTRPAKAYCTLLHGEDYIVTETAQLKGSLQFPLGPQYTEVAEVRRIADGRVMWAFFGDTTILRTQDTREIRDA